MLIHSVTSNLCDPMDGSQPGCSAHGDSPGKNTGVDCHALLQGIFSIQGSNPGLLYRRRILYRLSHQGSPESTSTCYKNPQFSHSVVSDSLQPHGLQHARPPCPSPTSRAYSNSCPLSWWCHPTIASSVVHPLLLSPSIFPSIRVFSNESVLHIRWPKYWSFSLSIRPSNEYSGLISFRMDWLDLLAVQGTLKKSLLQHHNSKPSILWHFNSHIHTWLLEKS